MKVDVSNQGLRSAIRRLAMTRDGEIVLEHLFNKYYHSRIRPETMAVQVGQRDVMRYIRTLIEDNNETTTA